LFISATNAGGTRIACSHCAGDADQRRFVGIVGWLCAHGSTASRIHELGSVSFSCVVRLSSDTRRPRAPAPGGM
jgi:hypothetical protein